MVLNLILASICIEKNWGDEKILVIPVTWQISAQPLPVAKLDQEKTERKLKLSASGLDQITRGKTSGWFWRFCNCVIGVIT